MIEVIYKDEKQEAKGNEGVFSVPKNIRQIGMIGEDYRIYMEDYVYTFLRKAAGAEKNGEEEKCCLAVLTGESKWASGVTYLFIKGALTVENTEVSSEHIDFSEEIWQKIQEDVGKYFEGQEIAGWFFAQKSLPLEASELFQKIHLKYFGGGEKVLMLMDPAEREEAFFRYENNFLVRQSGYYLYYEKNPQMQAYMLEKKPEFSEEDREEIQDEAVKAFRKIIKKKKDGDAEETEERTSVFSYAATACLVLAVAAVGMRFYQNYQNVQEVNTKTETVSAMLENGEEEPKDSQGAENGLSAENVTEETKTETQEGAEEQKSKEGLQDAAKEENNTVENEAVAESGLSASGNAAKNSENSADKGKTEVDAGEDASEETSSEELGSEEDSDEEEMSEEDAAIYREESDVRKAERRVQAARENAEDQNEDSDAEQTNTAGAQSGTSYVIRPGDTLYQISIEKYGTMDEVEEICRLNGLAEDEIIYPGQIIVLP
ncbi:MAG TPA: LysM peptidoglycan-binding domain-containing protein [Candidatus Blautia excrementipullorum]|nr:LysM peptidoglycan-binding domain-containing protein [Candidatus Blautia excrementipullorum]